MNFMVTFVFKFLLVDPGVQEWKPIGDFIIMKMKSAFDITLKRHYILDGGHSSNSTPRTYILTYKIQLGLTYDFKDSSC